MTPSSTSDLLAEVWAIKDSLSASHGHDLKATCRALYAEQQKHPGDFVDLGTAARQDKAPASHPISDPLAGKEVGPVD